MVSAVHRRAVLIAALVAITAVGAASAAHAAATSGGSHAWAAKKKGPSLKVTAFDFKQQGGKPTESAVAPGGKLLVCQSASPAKLYAFTKFNGMKKGDSLYLVWSRWNSGRQTYETVFEDWLNWKKGKGPGILSSRLAGAEGLVTPALYRFGIQTARNTDIATGSINVESTAAC